MVRYQAKGHSIGFDQVVSLENRTETSIVPTLQFIAHDHYGRPLPHVQAHSVLGFDRGASCVPAGRTGIDVLAFSGQGYRAVRGVTVNVIDVEEVPHPPLTADVELLMIDLEQRRTYDPTEFWGVGLGNRNDVEVESRVVLVQREPETADDNPRQVVDVVELTETVTVRAQSHEIVWLPESVRGSFDGVLGSPVPGLRL